MGASSSVGSLSYAEDVHKHNEQALRARDGRLTTLTQLPSPGTIDEFLDITWPLIRHLRLRRAAYVMADQLKDVENVPLAKVTDYANALLQDEDRQGRLPFLPKDRPNVGSYRDDEWQWGLDLAIGITTLATDLLRSVVAARRKLHNSEEIVRLAMFAWNQAVNGGVQLDQLGQHEERRARGDAVDPSVPVVDPSASVVDPSASVGKRIEALIMAVLDKYRRRMGRPEIPANQNDSDQQSPESDRPWRKRLMEPLHRRGDHVDGSRA
jgi:hypothetical protein